MTGKEILMSLGFSEGTVSRLIEAGVTVTQVQRGEKLIEKNTPNTGHVIFLDRGVTVQTNLPRVGNSRETIRVTIDGGGKVPVGFHSVYAPGQVRDADVIVAQAGNVVFVPTIAWRAEAECLDAALEANIKGEHIIIWRPGQT